MSAPAPLLIRVLNRTLRGWANYHRHVVAAEAFSRVASYLYHQLNRMLRRRHPKKSLGWLIRKYWTATGRKWEFAVWHRARGRARLYKVQRLWDIPLWWYRKVKAQANPYLPEFAAYFWRRRHDPASRRYGAPRNAAARAMAEREVEQPGRSTRASLRDA